MKYSLEDISYEFHIDGVPDITSSYSGKRRYTIRPHAVKLCSADGGKTVWYAAIEGHLVRQSDGTFGGIRAVCVGPRQDEAPSYVDEMLASLGLVWRGDRR